MHHFSTIIKLSRTAVPLNMLLLMAIILVSAAGPSKKLIPWGFIAFAALMAVVFTLNVVTMLKMGPQTRRLRELFRLGGLIATIGLALYLPAVAFTSQQFLTNTLNPAVESIAFAAVFVDLMVLASVGRA
ncbi:MAG: hypothetical protein RBT76_05700 [candidate division Zixibacteria bacterium]|jgi:D-alanyl-lipoteichoic acid acyltransferase DltB (MBOAT superfamily)|nr:hypothetical protein [candidate division Zixibacteria bacterium]